MKVSKRIITFFLAIAMLASMLPVANAASDPGLMVDSESVSSWEAWASSNGVSSSSYWTSANNLMSSGYVGPCDSLLQLQYITDKYDTLSAGIFASLVEIFSDLFNGSDYIVLFDDELGVYRPYDNNAHLWFVNSKGHFPYYDPDPSEVFPEDDNGNAFARTGQWILAENINSSYDLWRVVSRAELESYRAQWLDVFPDATLIKTEGCYWLVSYVMGKPQILCDEYGYPYFIPIDGESAITTPYQYFTNITNNYVDDKDTTVNVMMDGNVLVGKVIDNENGIINVGGKVYYIDELTYDASTRIYYVDAHDEYVYNTETNNYTTNNYSFQFEYHVSHTSITYIGQTEEYQERYEMYYQLPDGRSSADLTAEDLEQLSVVFKDVVLYARSADNVDMRALYHFDGNVEDSSYWSYATSFDWVLGASLTYLDEGVFNGSLYLDETYHSFGITLPNVTDIHGDFTLQFRYYQSHTTAPILDSQVELGGVPVLKFDGAYYYDLSGTLVAETSVGNWNELCIMRADGVMYYYINGVCVTSVEDNTLYSNVIRFIFGMNQETYKKLDELRFTRAAVYTPGEDYTSSAVPFDTNLALILPDGQRPMADEVLVITPAENNLITFPDPDTWADAAAAAAKAIPEKFTGNYYVDYVSGGLCFLYNSEYTSISSSGDTFTFSVSGENTTEEVDLGGGFSWSGGICNNLTNGIFFPLRAAATSSDTFSLLTDGSYTFSLILSDGTVASASFTYDSSGGINGLDFIQNFTTVDGSSLILSVDDLFHYNEVESSGYLMSWSGRIAGISIMPADISAPVDIVYVELVSGSKPGYTQTWETAMYSSGELEESPVLAVRTNMPITGYQIGGVRPSYPTPGLVYAMVENSRITSLQQYSGSAWIAVDGRIWTGQRWIPYSSFDVFTLQDLFDIIGGSDDDYEYIYTESGFWTWFQKQWKQFMNKLDEIIDLLSGNRGGSDCDHVYHTEIQREATCAEPGHMLYTCDLCADTYTELIEPIGHDWIVQDHVDEVLDEEGNVVEKGYDIVVCSVCELESKDYGDGPIENDLFDAIGDLIAEGIDWILEKLSQVTDSLSGITDTFNSFVDRIGGMTDEYTLMFGAFLALLPEDLRTLMWLAIVAGVVGLVWKAWAK